MAAWCIHTSMPPEVYRSLTILERNEFIKAVNRTRK